MAARPEPRWIPVVVAAVLALGLALLLLRDQAPESAVEVEEAGAPSATPARRTARRAAGAGAPGEETGQARGPAPFEPRSPPEEALAAAAEATGMGLVRCPLPPDTPEDARLGLHRAVREGDGLTAMVASSEGITQIRLPSPPPDLLHEDVEAWKEALRASRVPLGVLTWGDAHLGEEGWCELEEPAQITISGRIVTPDGEPAPDALVNGCVGGSTFPDEHGHFEMQAWRGAPCTLSVNRAGIPGDGVEVSRDGDQHGIVMVQEPIDASVAIDQHAAELERQQAQLHPLEVALEDPDLSAEARALLDGWLEEEREETERIIAISEHHAGFFFEAQEREDQE